MIDLNTLVGAVGGGTITLFVLLFWVFVHPEIVEKWMALGYRALSGFPRAFGAAHRRYVKYDLQSRVNQFASSVNAVAPFLAEERVQLEWVPPDTSREAFLEQNRMVIRLKRTDPEEQNFVHAAYLFVGSSLLHRMKPYMSNDQRVSLDMYLTMKLLQMEKKHASDYFLSHYLHPSGTPAIDSYYEQLAVSDQGGVLFNVYLPELSYLSTKVFGNPLNDTIAKELDKLLAFVVSVAQRRLCENIELTYYGTFCRVGIVIVGKREKVSVGASPWAQYIKQALIPRRTESIYVLGPASNKTVMNGLADGVKREYDCVLVTEGVADLPREDEVVVKTAISTMTLRLRAVSPFESRGLRALSTAEHPFSPPAESTIDAKDARPESSDPPTRTATGPLGAPVASAVPASIENRFHNPSLKQLGFVENFGNRRFGFLTIPTDPFQTKIFFHESNCENAPNFIEIGSLVECDIAYRASDQKWFATRVAFQDEGADGAHGA